MDLGGIMFKQSIYFFIAVVETGSFSGAAKQFYLSQSAISQQVSKLESELGFILFDRTGYRPKLTKAGEYYYKGVKELLKQYEELEKESKLYKVNKELVIGITSSFERKTILPIIMKYKDEHNIKVKIEMHNFNEVTKLVLNRKLDLAFGINNDFKRYSSLNYRDLFKHHVCIVCSKEHPLSNYDAVHIKDIRNQNVVALSRNVGEGFYEDFMASFKLDGMKPHIIKEVDTLDEFLISVKMNEGIGFTSTEIIDDEDICTVDILDSHHHAYFAVAYRKDNSKDYIEPLVDLLSDKLYKYNL